MIALTAGSWSIGAMDEKVASIALLDDDASLLSLYTKILVMNGYQAIPFRSVQSVKEKIAQLPPPDLFLVDHQLPEMSGPEFVIMMRKDYLEFSNKTHFIGFSSIPRDSSMADEFRDLDIDFANKPNSIEDFLKLISDHLSRLSENKI